MLRDGYKRNTLPIENLHDACEVHERPAESVDLVDDHAVDLAGFDIGEQSLECRTLHVAARKSTVVVMIGKANPTFVLLAGNVRVGAVALGIKRIVILLKSLFCAFARIDGTTHIRLFLRLVVAASVPSHAAFSLSLRGLRTSPKK